MNPGSKQEAERRIEQLNSQLFDAIRKNDLDAIQNLLKSGADVNALGGNGLFAKTPLWIATLNRNLAIIKCLLKYGAKVDKSCPTTPLMIAACQQNADAAQILLEHGADANIRTNGHTALTTFGNFHNYPCCKLLVEAMLELTPAQKKISSMPLYSA